MKGGVAPDDDVVAGHNSATEFESKGFRRYIKLLKYYRNWDQTLTILLILHLLLSQYLSHSIWAIQLLLSDEESIAKYFIQLLYAHETSVILEILLIIFTIAGRGQVHKLVSKNHLRTNDYRNTLFIRLAVQILICHPLYHFDFKLFVFLTSIMILKILLLMYYKKKS